jgi:hypothetical protein
MIFTGFAFFAAEAMVLSVPIAQARAAAASLAHHDLGISAPQNSQGSALVRRIARVKRPKQPPMIAPAVVSAWPISVDQQDVSVGNLPAPPPPRSSTVEHPPA